MNIVLYRISGPPYANGLCFVSSHPHSACSFFSLKMLLRTSSSLLVVMFEIMLMAGIPYASHRDLAHAWGREKGFHNVLVSQVCDRRGEIARKKRSDSGRQMSQEQKAIFKEKLKRARANKKPKIAGEVLGGTGIRAVPVPVGVVPVHAPIPGIPGLNELPPASVEEMVQEQAEEAEMGDSAEV